MTRTLNRQRAGQIGHGLGNGGAARTKAKPAAGQAQYEKVDKSEVEMV